MRLPIRISFSADQFDQWRLSKVGGSIKNVKGKEVFVFESEQQYREYQALNAHKK